MPNGGVIRVGMANQRLGPGSVAQLGAGDYLCITLSDTGVGIQPENLAHIFEPYFTTKKSGHGLGLAMVYSIIRRHGGHIEVESELGRGTCFRFCLPAIHERVAPVDELAVTPPRSASGRILFMDDEAPIRQLVEVLLQRLGFKVVLSADGEEAIALYRAALAGPEPFDLVIMDLTVPGGMGGREAMLELRRLDPGVKGLVSSGYSSDPVLANFRVHGFSGMVSKPYRLTDLAKAVRAVLEAPTV
jgi:CheY-like chemotaxis protein